LQQLSDNKKILWALILDLLFLCIGFTLNVVYLKTVLGYSSKLVSLYITLNNLGGTLILPLMGRVLDRNLQKGSRYICRLYLIYMVVLIMLPVNLSGSMINVVFITMFSLLSGVIASGVYLMMTILQHSLVKTEDSLMVLNLYQIIIYAAAFVSTNVFGSIINYASHVRISMIYLFSLDIFKCVYVFLIMSSVVIVKKVFHKMYES
jgi:MFS family permease